MTTFSSFHGLVFCLFSGSFYLYLSPPAEVISSHLLPKPLCFHPPPPLEKALSASGSKASPAPTTSCRGSSSCTVQDPVPGLWQLLSRSPTAVYWLPPTAEEEGDTGVSASGQRHTKYTNRKHKNKKCTIPNSKFQIHTTGTARRLCHLPIHESDGKVQITTLILSDQLRCLTTTALRI